MKSLANTLQESLHYFKKIPWLLFLFLLFAAGNLNAQGHVEFFTANSENTALAGHTTAWVAPVGVTTITVVCWGGGGAGGGATGNPAVGGGGAGGAYSRKVLNVIPGQTYYIHVGAGGAGGTGDGPSGFNSWFSPVTGANSQSSATMLAQGGAGGLGAAVDNTAGTGGLGSLSSSMGTILRKGGDGATGIAGTISGGGGEAGGISGPGNNGGFNGTASSGGSGLYDGGNGGNGGGNSANGSNGAVRVKQLTAEIVRFAAGGGGGGGARAGSATDRSGGSGAVGEVRIYWCVGAPALPDITSYQGTQDAQYMNISVCPGTEVGGGGQNDFEIFDDDDWEFDLDHGYTFDWEVSLDNGANWQAAASGTFPGILPNTIQTPYAPYYNTDDQYPFYSYFQNQGNYKFRVKVSNACGSTYSDPTQWIGVAINGPTATATTVPNDNLCNNQVLTLTSSSVGGGATTGAWSIVSLVPDNGGINGTLSSTAQTANPSAITYTPPAGYAGTVILRLTTNLVMDADCGGDPVLATADRIINVGAPPVITQPVNIVQSCPNNQVNFPSPTISGNPTIFTFTPASGANFPIGVTQVTLTASNGCGDAVAKMFNVTINGPGTTPIFSGLPTSICRGAVPPALPAQSDNGINGTWSPSSISSLISGDYTFLPAVGQCAEGYSFHVDVTPVVIGISLSAGTANVDVDPFIRDASCRLIAKVVPSGGNPVSGLVDGKVWVQPAVPYFSPQRPFVERHYQITPQVGAGTKSATVTLYYLQGEFSDFNNSPDNNIDFPVDPSDIQDFKANIRVFKFPGISSDGTGLPSTYSGGPTLLDPNTYGISYSFINNWWEITFPVTSFSGFIVGTALLDILPVNLLSFDGKVAANDMAELNWQTTGEKDFSYFEVQSSIDGRSFANAGKVQAKNIAGNNSYVFSTKMSANSVYYRLKLNDKNGKYSYSQTINLKLKSKNAISIYPNPVRNKLSVEMKNSKEAALRMIDINGRLVLQQKVQPGLNTIDIERLPAGVYNVEVNDGTTTTRQKVVKQ